MSIPFTPENRDKMLRVAEYLSGTCKSLEDGLESEFGEGVDVIEFDIELLRTLDDQVMCCEGCQWWCETHDLDDNQLCEDCQ